MKEKVLELKRKAQRLEVELRELELDVNELIKYKEDAYEYKRTLDGLEKFERLLDDAIEALEQVTRRL